MIVDRGTQEGFTVVAEAREYLLRLGKKVAKQPLDISNEDTNTAGCHVVAPVCTLPLFDLAELLC
jgi:ribosomal protein RSM22 (predicted rRNA methylase)